MPVPEFAPAVDKLIPFRSSKRSMLSAFGHANLLAILRCLNRTLQEAPETSGNMETLRSKSTMLLDNDDTTKFYLLGVQMEENRIHILIHPHKAIAIDHQAEIPHCPNKDFTFHTALGPNQ